MGIGRQRWHVFLPCSLYRTGWRLIGLWHLAEHSSSGLRAKQTLLPEWPHRGQCLNIARLIIMGDIIFLLLAAFVHIHFCVVYSAHSGQQIRAANLEEFTWFLCSLQIYHTQSFHFIKPISIAHRDNPSTHKMQFLNANVIYLDTKIIQNYLSLCKKSNCPPPHPPC